MPKIKAYHRPANLEEALRLLARPGVTTVVMGGGAHLTAQLSDEIEEVVDLQAIGLDNVHYQGEQLTLGAMVRLQTVVDDGQAPALLRQAAHREGPNTFRHAATVGGVVVGASPESEFLAALLVFEAQVHVQSPAQAGGGDGIPLNEFLQDVPAALAGGIVTQVSLATGGKTASARVGRTPADQPIVAAVARLTPQGQRHLALCGVAATPILIDPANLKSHLNPPADFRGSSQYRREIAAALAERVMAEVNI